VDYLELAGEGHVYRRAESRTALVAAMVRFLAAQLSPAAEVPAGIPVARTPEASALDRC
jgi:hypothetical protein